MGNRIGELLRLLAGERVDDARTVERRRDIDRQDAGVRMRAAEDGDVMQIQQPQIVGVLGAAGEKAVTLSLWLA